MHHQARVSTSSSKALALRLSTIALLACCLGALAGCASEDAPNDGASTAVSGGPSGGATTPAVGGMPGSSVNATPGGSPGVAGTGSAPPANTSVTPGGSNPAATPAGSGGPGATPTPTEPGAGGEPAAGGATPIEPASGSGGTGGAPPVSTVDDGGEAGMSAGGMGGAPDGNGGAPPTEDWLTSWGTSIQSMEPSNMPPPLGGMTLRQYVWVTFSGDTIRLELSNEKGTAPVEITKVHIAKPGQGAGQIDPATDAEFTFGGTPDVSIPPGEAIWSDPLDYSIVELDRMALTMHFSSVPNEITGHPGARNTAYIGNGDVVADASFNATDTRDRWYFINTIDVMAPADTYTVALLGDSITDGYGVLNAFQRWPDYLTLSIKDDPEIADKLSVLNLGMGANELLTPTDYMDAGIDRFKRDVLGDPKIKWLIVLMGVNDIGEKTDLSIAGRVTDAYQEIVELCHAEGILVYGSPITPFRGHSYDAGQALTLRNDINDWVINQGSFDTVIRLDEAVADPADPEQLLQRLSNDGLHPNTAGYEAMGNAVDTSLFHEMLP